MNQPTGDVTDVPYRLPTPLDDAELVWLEQRRLGLGRLDNDRILGDPPLRRTLFRLLWVGNSGRCATCGAQEGFCRVESCIRTRITKKILLGSLYESGESVEQAAENVTPPGAPGSVRPRVMASGGTRSAISHGRG
jgi:hypothetical protein